MTDTLLLDTLVFYDLMWFYICNNPLFQLFGPHCMGWFVGRRSSTRRGFHDSGPEGANYKSSRCSRFVWFGFELLLFFSQSSGETSLFKLRCFFGSVYFQLGPG